MNYLSEDRALTLRCSRSSVSPSMPLSSLCSSTASACRFSFRKRKFVRPDIADMVFDMWKMICDHVAVEGEAVSEHGVADVALQSESVFFFLGAVLSQN